MNDTFSAEQIAAAIQDPAAMFATPEAVVAHPALSREDKIKILESWKVDATLLMTAEQENMESVMPQGSAAEKLRLIAKAADKIG